MNTKSNQLVNESESESHQAEKLDKLSFISVCGNTVMKLTIVRLENFSEQDYLDLAKIWPEYPADSLRVDESHRIYAARFNDRLLGAVRVTLRGTEGAMDSLRVREVTRRRGVGHYLIEETIRDNPSITDWWVMDIGVEDYKVMNAFMQTLGFDAQQDGWLKRLS